MDNLLEIFPSIHEYLEDHQQLLQIPSHQPKGLSQPDIIVQEDPTSNPNLLDSLGDGGGSIKTATCAEKIKTRQEVKIKSGDDSCRRALHRDVERRRRNEMANLYASLRSLLPLEYIKGKRSVSDHMRASVSYIKDLQKKIEGLHNRREKMKKKKTTSNMVLNTVENEKTAKCCLANNISITVNKFQEGVEILISTCLALKGAYPLSKVLETLHRQGLNVVSCAYSQQRDWSLLRIQAQVNELSGVDVAALQQILIDVVIKRH